MGLSVDPITRRRSAFLKTLRDFVFICGENESIINFTQKTWGAFFLNGPKARDDWMEE
jgi:hypothetical protein